MQLTTDKLNKHNYIETYRGEFEMHPQKDILNNVVNIKDMFDYGLCLYITCKYL